MGTLTRVGAVVAAIASAVAILLVIAHHTSSPPGQAAGASTIRATFDPPAVQFGDALTLHIAARLDNRTVLPDTFRLTSSTSPLTTLGRSLLTRTTRGHVTVISITVPTACIVTACVADPGETAVKLPVVTAQVIGTDGRPRTLSTTWPRLQVGSRVATGDIEHRSPPLRTDTALVAPSYRIAPRRLALLLDAAAVLLAALGIWFGARQITAIVRERRSSTDVDQLVEALRFLRESGARSPGDRRRAIGLLARVLERRGHEHAEASTDLAWSRPAPTAESTTELAARVERARKT